MAERTVPFLIPLDIPPGIYRTGTDYSSKGRWLNANLWRWYSREQRPVGGWVQRSKQEDGEPGSGAAALTGKARAIVTWKSNNSKSWCAVGTHTGLYVMTAGGFTYDITPDDFASGYPSASQGGAYGSGVYGAGVYGFGVPTDAVTKEASVWSLDTWGENLVGVMAEDGKIYEWAPPDVSEKAAVISGAPENNRAIVVTAENIMIALGADGNPRKVKWSNQDDNTAWTPGPGSYAGEYDLRTVGRLQCGRQVAGGTLLLTDVDAWFASFSGQPFVFGFQQVGKECGIVSRSAIVTVGVQAFWMSQNGFWRFNGYSEAIDCTVHDYVFSDINTKQISKVSAVHVSAFGEIWWFYPSSGSSEIDRYVTYNYRENHWNIGTLPRLCGVDRGAFPYVMMVDASGVVWDHERGFDHGGVQPFVESGPVEIGQGDRVVIVRQILPDEKVLGDVEVTFKTAFQPMGDETEYGPYTLTADTPVLFTARQAKVRLTADDGADFRVGSFRFNVAIGGER